MSRVLATLAALALTLTGCGSDAKRYEWRLVATVDGPATVYVTGGAEEEHRTEDGRFEYRATETTRDVLYNLRVEPDRPGAGSMCEIYVNDQLFSLASRFC